MEEIDVSLMGKNALFDFSRNDHRNVILNHLIISFVFEEIIVEVHAYLFM